MAGYLNVETVKSILQERGQAGNYTSAVMRIKNIGADPADTRTVETHGYISHVYGHGKPACG